MSALAARRAAAAARPQSTPEVIEAPKGVADAESNGTALPHILPGSSLNSQDSLSISFDQKEAGPSKRRKVNGVEKKRYFRASSGSPSVSNDPSARVGPYYGETARTRFSPSVPSRNVADTSDSNDLDGQDSSDEENAEYAGGDDILRDLSAQRPVGKSMAKPPAESRYPIT